MPISCVLASIVAVLLGVMLAWFYIESGAAGGGAAVVPITATSLPAAIAGSTSPLILPDAEAGPAAKAETADPSHLPFQSYDARHNPIV